MPLPQYEPKPEQHPLDAEKERLDSVTNNIAVRVGIHAGKGGVGKTFLATQLALGLKDKWKVGLIDADVDCPNVPQALNVQTQLDMEDGKMIPANVQGIKVVSSGFMQQDEPIIIRGPIKHRLLTDFIEHTNWGELDVLIFDFPPGTSDVPLSAMQVANLTGVIIVTTPDRSSLADAKRAIQMAQRFGVKIYGLVENMTGDVFGEGEGKKLAEEYNIPFLCAIPLDANLRKGAETGKAVLSEEHISAISRALFSVD